MSIHVQLNKQLQAYNYTILHRITYINIYIYIYYAYYIYTVYIVYIIYIIVYLIWVHAADLLRRAVAPPTGVSPFHQVFFQEEVPQLASHRCPTDA